MLFWFSGCVCSRSFARLLLSPMRKYLRPLICNPACQCAQKHFGCYNPAIQKLPQGTSRAFAAASLQKHAPDDSANATILHLEKHCNIDTTTSTAVTNQTLANQVDRRCAQAHGGAESSGGPANRVNKNEVDAKGRGRAQRIVATSPHRVTSRPKGTRR